MKRFGLQILILPYLIETLNTHMPKLPTFKEFTDPCWSGYQMVGMKSQDGKDVPNCVPEEQGTTVMNGDANVQTSTPADREWGTDSLVRIYKQMTPGETEQMDLVPMRSVNERIVKVKGGFRLVSKKTGKNLGTYRSKGGAENRERQVQYFKHQKESSMSIPSFKQFMAEQPETVLVKPATPGALVSDVTPPGMEKWIKRNRAQFRKQYGERAEELLHATAWDRYEKGKRDDE